MKFSYFEWYLLRY